MIDTPSHVGDDRRRELLGLAYAAVIDEVSSSDLETMVRVASELLAEGVDIPSVVELASQLSHPDQLDEPVVVDLYSTMCGNLGVDVPTPPGTPWQRAKLIADAIVAGSIRPPIGANQLWWLWDDCGEPSLLVQMLQLKDEWENSVGEQAREVEARMVALASKVVADAERRADDLGIG